jgi:hypothetical protein
MYAGALADVGSNGSMDIVGPQSYFEGPTKMYTSKVADSKLPLDKWTYIQVDDSRDGYVIPGASTWWNYFGLDMFDVNRDGYTDIVAGEWFYRNPGGDMTAKWERITFPVEVDAVLALDVHLVASLDPLDETPMALGDLLPLRDGVVGVTLHAVSGGVAPAFTDDGIALAATSADVVVTMGCGDTCPVLPGKRYLDWELDDPAGKGVAEVRPVRDEIERRVRGLLEELQVPHA